MPREIRRPTYARLLNEEWRSGGTECGGMVRQPPLAFVSSFRGPASRRTNVRGGAAGTHCQHSSASPTYLAATPIAQQAGKGCFHVYTPLYRVMHAYLSLHIIKSVAVRMDLVYKRFYLTRQNGETTQKTANTWRMSQGFQERITFFQNSIQKPSLTS